MRDPVSKKLAFSTEFNRSSYPTVCASDGIKLNTQTSSKPPTPKPVTHLLILISDPLLPHLVYTLLPGETASERAGTNHSRQALEGHWGLSPALGSLIVFLLPEL